MAEAPMSWKTGGCHCGAVRFEVLAPDEIEAKECNCSICRKSGYLHLIVEKERFRLVEGARQDHDLHLQHRHGEASFLLGVRHKELLRAALEARRL